MIPVFNRTEYLETTLRSVLMQAQTPDWMEIVLVDNCSDQGNPREVMERIGSDRIAYHRNQINLGLAGNFNRCIELAKGAWIHILHADDFVYEGFYKEVERISSDKAIQAIAFRCHIVSEDDTITSDTPNLSGHSDSRIRHHFLNDNPVQCPGIILKREVYETLGGWMPQFQFLVDVEMWTRAFFNVPTYFSGRMMAAFRMHGESESSKLSLMGADRWEHYRVASHVIANMRLTKEEKKRYFRWLHKVTNKQCRQFATMGEVRRWLAMQKLYFGNVRGFVESYRYFCRLVGNGFVLLGNAFRSKGRH